jgi:hypothetical protein
MARMSAEHHGFLNVIKSKFGRMPGLSLVGSVVLTHASMRLSTRS